MTFEDQFNDDPFLKDLYLEDVKFIWSKSAVPGLARLAKSSMQTMQLFLFSHETLYLCTCQLFIL